MMKLRLEIGAEDDQSPLLLLFQPEVERLLRTDPNIYFQYLRINWFLIFPLGSLPSTWKAN